MQMPTCPGHPEPTVGELGWAGSSAATSHPPMAGGWPVTVDTKAQRTQQDGRDVLVSPSHPRPVGGVAGWVTPGPECWRAHACLRGHETDRAGIRALEVSWGGAEGRGQRARCASVEGLQGSTSGLQRAVLAGTDRPLRLRGGERGEQSVGLWGCLPGASWAGFSMNGLILHSP